MKKYFLSEFIGTAFLLIIVVGSGIMGEQLSKGNEAIALLANSIVTGAGLFVLIQNLGPISGAHFNPVLSLMEFFWKRLDQKSLIMYWFAQVTGAILGVIITHFIFNQNIFQISTKSRFSFNIWASEVIATFGLICTVALAGKRSPRLASLNIAAYVTAAYWFTSSTSFANPAVTLARMLTNTFCGISPGSVLPFIFAQIIGSILAFILLKQHFKSI